MNDSKSITGHGVGWYEIQTEKVYTEIRFRMKEGHIRAVADLRFEGDMGMDLTHIALQGSRLHFELQNPSGVLIFDGEVSNGVISGKVHQGERSGIFTFICVFDMEPSLCNQYQGIYQQESHGLVSIGKGPLSLYWFEHDSGKFRTLFPVSETTMIAGPTMSFPLPLETTITFVKNQNGVDNLILQSPGLPKRPAQKVNVHHEEDVQFSSGDVTLAGTLLTPSGSGPHAAVVLLHGARPQPRNGFLSLMRFTAHMLTLSGLAVLIYDKRGVGGSTGKWDEATIPDLTSDALAAVEFLRGYSTIDPAKVGLWGISQGGQMCSRAASLSDDVAFIILVSCSLVSPAEQDMYRMEQQFRLEGHTENVIKKAMDVWQLFYEVVSTGKGREDYDAAVEEARKNGALLPLLPPTEMLRTSLSFHADIGYDPALDIKKVTCPVLAVWGGLDKIVPAKKSAHILDEALKKSGNTDYTIKVFPRANHLLFEAETGGYKEFPSLKRVVPGYFDTLEEWIHERVTPSLD